MAVPIIFLLPHGCLCIYCLTDVDGGANVVPTLEPYEFEVATQGIVTTTIPVPTIPTKAPTTVPTKDPAPITTEMEKQSTPEATILTPPEPSSGPSNKKMTAGKYVYLVQGYQSFSRLTMSSRLNLIIGAVLIVEQALFKFSDGIKSCPYSVKHKR